MFNPANLKIVCRRKNLEKPSPFVGIKKANDGEMRFYLPFGFDDFPLDNTHKAKDSQQIIKLFFDLYKTFKHFQRYVQSNFERKSPSEDGLLRKERGFTFANKEDELVTLCSKIANLESILDGYDELRIFSIVMRSKRTTRVDYAQISKYLHQAVFLKNHVPYVDEMVLPEPIIEHTITDLVRMYCYVYCEVKQQLEENVPIEIKNQAQLFQEYNLQPDSSLFSHNHDFTIQLLRTELDSIHRQVSLKDDDYWHFYKALEDFLYGVLNFSNGGVFWGITSFALVWEDMCMVYLRHKDWNGVWYADSARFANTKIGGSTVFLDHNFESPFYFKLNDENRHLRPDLVRINQRVDKWFEDTFDVKFEGNSCRVVLKNPSYLSYFNNAIDKTLRVHGRRQKKDSDRFYTYAPVTKEKVQKAVNLAKSKFLEKNSAVTHHHLIVDIKYVNPPAYEQSKLSSKISHDVNKQMIYEYAIHLNAPHNLTKITSQFRVPYFYEFKEEPLYVEMKKHELNELLQELGIEVLKVNFLVIQNIYNTHASLAD